MRKATLLILSIALTATLAHPALCISKHAAKPASPTVAALKQVGGPCADAPQLQLPDGATLKNEINLDDQNLLAAIKQAVPAFTKGLGDSAGDVVGFAKGIDLNGVASVLQGLSAVRIATFSLAPKSDPAKALAFFEEQLPESKGWKRMFYSTEIIDSCIAVAYSQNGKAYLAMVLAGDGNSGYLSTQGFVDIPKLAGWAGSILRTMNRGEGAITGPAHAKSGPAPMPAPTHAKK